MAANRRLICKKLDGRFWENFRDRKTITCPESKHTTFSIDSSDSSADYPNARHFRSGINGGTAELGGSCYEKYFESVERCRACAGH